jgi:hypothetical protein
MWYQATGAKMIGAVGKTQYMTNELPVLVLATGRWEHRILVNCERRGQRRRMAAQVLGQFI